MVNPLRIEKSSLELWSPRDLVDIVGICDSREPRRVGMVYLRLWECQLELQGGELPRQMAASWFVDWEHELSSGQYSDACNALLKPSVTVLSTEKLYWPATLWGKAILISECIRNNQSLLCQRLYEASKFLEMGFNQMLSLMPPMQRINPAYLPHSYGCRNFVISNFTHYFA